MEPLTVGRLASAVAVAEAALDAARAHTLDQRNTAQRALIAQLVLLALAISLAVHSGYLDRNDEVGALAGALETFKQQATEKLKIEEHERERNAGAVARQRGRGLCRGVRGRGAQDAGRTERCVGAVRKTWGDLSAVYLRNFTAETLSKFLPFSGQMRSERLPEAGAPDCTHPFGFEVRGAAFQGP